MSLTGREQHALRRIERALRRGDPALARRFDSPVDQRTRLVRRLADAFAAVVVALIACGLILDDQGMILGGCLVLLFMPITVVLVAAAQRRGP